MSVEQTILDYRRDEWLSLLGLVGVDDPKIAAISALSWGGNGLKYLRVNSTENGWELVASTALVAAADVANTPAGNIAATNVQAALNELDTEKLAASSYTAADVLSKLLTVDGSGSGLDADTLRGTTPAAFGLSLVDDANAAVARTTLGLGTLATVNTVNDGDWSGTDLAIANGGTGSSSASAARTALGLEIGTNVQAYDPDLTTWAGITPGTGVGTALAVNVGSAGAFVAFNGALGTPSSGTLTNATGLPIGSGVSGLGTGVATFLATPSSANFAAAVTGETGTGNVVFSADPTLTGNAALQPVANKRVKALAVAASSIADFVTGAAGLSFSRPSDGADDLVALFHYIGTGTAYQVALAARNDVVLATGGGSNFAAATEALRLKSTKEAVFAGAIATPGATITTTTTLDATHSMVLCDATSAAFTVNLPAAAGVPGRVYTIKKIDSTGNAITIDGNASETIDGATTASLTTQWQSKTIQAVGGAWYVK